MGLGTAIVGGVVETGKFLYDVESAVIAHGGDLVTQGTWSGEFTAAWTPTSGLGGAVSEGQGTQAVTGIVTGLPDRIQNAADQIVAQTENGNYYAAGQAFGSGPLTEATAALGALNLATTTTFSAGSFQSTGWTGAGAATTTAAANDVSAAGTAGSEGSVAATAASTGENMAPVQLVRVIQPGETVADLIQEIAQRTYESGGNEHAIVSMENGPRVIMQGGPGGMQFGPDVSRVICHTHPMTTGPSAADFAMLEALGQQSSWIYELFGGGLTKFTRPK